MSLGRDWLPNAQPCLSGAHELHSKTKSTDPWPPSESPSSAIAWMSKTSQSPYHCITITRCKKYDAYGLSLNHSSEFKKRISIIIQCVTTIHYLNTDPGLQAKWELRREYRSPLESLCTYHPFPEYTGLQAKSELISSPFAVTIIHFMNLCTVRATRSKLEVIGSPFTVTIIHFMNAQGYSLNQSSEENISIHCVTIIHFMNAQGYSLNQSFRREYLHSLCHHYPLPEYTELQSKSELRRRTAIHCVTFIHFMKAQGYSLNQSP